MDVVRFAAGDGTPLSGWYLEGSADLPVLVAIHGGSSTSAYWNLAAMGDAALPRVAEAAGFPVVAVDRPSRPVGDRRPVPSLAEQATLVARTVPGLAGPLGRRRPVPVVAVGHSIGGMVAVHLAAQGGDGVRVLGLEISGLGLRYRDDAPLEALHAAAALDAPVPVAAGSRRRFFGPAEGWDPCVAAEDTRSAVPAEPSDVAEVVAWPGALPVLAGRVRVPLRLVVGQHDVYWPADGLSLADAALAFRAAPWVEVRAVPGAGHSLQLHRAAGSALRELIDFVRALPDTHEHDDAGGTR
jgi:pimeloyl-ACP methyl ester carboxylesterase